VASFYNMTNRLAAATDMKPNREYHYLARERPANTGQSGKPERGGAASLPPGSKPAPAARRRQLRRGE
jgi:hypothetical protein